VHWLNCQLDGPASANLGRRQAKLLAANQFWLLSKEKKAELVAGSQSVEANPFTHELLNRPDPFDQEDPPEKIVNRRGLILRTDFSNDNAWNDFCEIVRRSERDGLQTESASSSAAAPEGSESESDSEDDEPSDLLVFAFHNPPPEHRGILTNQTNLALLRLFLDVDISPSSLSPQKATEIVNKVPIFDCDGYQEVYKGPLLWAYDATSNQDGSVRLITSHGRMQSNIATGDSWRVKARSIWDLQLNLDAGTIAELDFHYDSYERALNVAEWGIMPHDTQAVQQYCTALQTSEVGEVD